MSIPPKAAVAPAEPDLPPPPESVLAAQKALSVLPRGFVRGDDGRIHCEKDGAEMILVPEGEFVMGATAGDSEAQENEKPAHRVQISAFLADRHEVTNGQFAHLSWRRAIERTRKTRGRGPR